MERASGDVLKVELAVVSALREYRDEKGHVNPVANSKAFVGEEITLVPVSMDQISRLKNKKVWNSDVPGGWITHAQPAGAKSRLPKETAGEDDNLFEKLGKL